MHPVSHAPPMPADPPTDRGATRPGKSGQSVGHMAKAAVSAAREQGIELPNNAQGMAASMIAKGVDAETVFAAMIEPAVPDEIPPPDDMPPPDDVLQPDDMPPSDDVLQPDDAVAPPPPEVPVDEPVDEPAAAPTAAVEPIDIGLSADEAALALLNDAFDAQSDP